MSPFPRPRESTLVALAMISATLAMAMLGWLVAWDPARVTRLVAEDGPVEWAQAGACALAAVVCAGLAATRHRRGADPSFDAVLAAALIFLMIGEVDLDKRLFGVKVIATRFFVNPSVPHASRVLALTVVVGVPVLIAVYALMRRRALWAAGLEELRHPTGWMLVAGVLLFGLTELLERPLGRVPGVPRYVLEESLELVATLWMLAGVGGRWLRLRESSST